MAELRAQHQAGAGSPLAHCQGSSGLSLQRLCLVTASAWPRALQDIVRGTSKPFLLKLDIKGSVFPTERSEGFATSSR